MHVILDTNIYFTSWGLDSNEFKKLFEYLNKWNCQIVLPHIIFMEVIENYRQELISLQDLINKIKNRSNRLLVDPNLELKKIDIENQVLLFEQLLRKRIEGRSINLLEQDHSILPAIIKKAIKKDKPFGQNGSGFKDALIWESIKKVTNDTRYSPEFAFISANIKDFGNENKLFDELAGEIKDNKNKVCYFNSLGSFLQEHGQKVDFIDSDFISHFFNNRPFFHDYDVDKTDLDNYELNREIGSDYRIEFIDNIKVDNVDLDYFYISEADSESYYVVCELILNVIVEITKITDAWADEDGPISKYQTVHEYIHRTANIRIDKDTHEIEEV